MAGIFLVTGATGLVGNNVTRQLLEQGCKTRVLIRGESLPRALAGLDVEVARGDIRDPESLAAGCRGADCVIHSAGYVHLGRSKTEEHHAINVEGTRNVARAAREAGARMLHVSSCDALGVVSLKDPADEDTPLAKPVCCAYVHSKRAGEQVVREEESRGLEAVIVNPSFMLGPWDWKPSSGRMLLEVARGRGLFAPRGYFSVCDVRDVATAILSAARNWRPGRRYILAGKTTSYIQAWRLFAEITGGRRPLFCPGPLMLWAAGKLGDLYGYVTGEEPDLNSGALALARLPKNYSSERAKRELGYVTRPFEQSARDAWNWFLEYGYAQRS